MASNRIRFEWIGFDEHRPSLVVDLVERDGALTAIVARPGWVESLDRDSRRTLDDALLGLYTMGAVDRADLAEASAEVSKIVVNWSDWVAEWDAECSGRRTEERRFVPLPPAGGRDPGDWGTAKDDLDQIQ